MQLTNLNRVNDIGSNSLLLEIGPFNIIIDAGINPKKKGKECLPNFEKLQNNSIDFIIVTHAHLDHIGALPVLSKAQKNTKILLAKFTKNICLKMLLNSYSIMKIHKHELKIQEYPLYKKKDINLIENKLNILKIGKTKSFIKNDKKLEITFYDSGHLPGSCGVFIRYENKKIFFTGDVLFEEQLTVNAASFPKEKFDVLIMETTRGNIENANSRQSEIKRFIQNINETLNNNGLCLIPVFALGRMQEILSIFYYERLKNNLIKCPIFCSGLGLSLVKFFKNKKILLHKILNIKRLKKININNFLKYKLEKGIYLVSSGMLLEKTPSYILSSLIINHIKNSIFFVGYCDPETPGGKIKELKYGDHFCFHGLNNYKTMIKAKIDTFDLSSHANRNDLIKFAIKNNPKSIYLTHGDANAKIWFKNNLLNHLHTSKVIDLMPLMKYNLT